MCSKQLYAKCHHRDHPCHRMMTRLPQKRPMKSTLKSSYAASVHPEPTTHAIKQCMNSLHTQAVTNSRSTVYSKLLGTAPPKLSTLEDQLPRPLRRICAQLRSSYCPKLRSYTSRLDPTKPEACRHCNKHPETVPHILGCKGFTDTRIPCTDLWNRPNELRPLLERLLNF